MRQVFLEKPWIYHREPAESAEVFLRFGRLERFKRGASFSHGGKNGRIYYLNEGLVACSSMAQNGQNFMLCLVPPKRVFCDIDGISESVVNVYVTAIRHSSVYSLDFDTWYRHLDHQNELALKIARNLIAKFESHLEAMIANFTLSLSDRFRAFLKVLLTSYSGSTVLNEWNEIPIYLSAQEYAELMGASRVSISRLTSKWQREQLLRKEGRSLFVNAALLQSVYDWVDSPDDEM